MGTEPDDSFVHLGTYFPFAPRFYRRLHSRSSLVFGMKRRWKVAEEGRHSFSFGFVDLVMCGFDRASQALSQMCTQKLLGDARMVV